MHSLEKVLVNIQVLMKRHVLYLILPLFFQLLLLHKIDLKKKAEKLHTIISKLQLDYSNLLMITFFMPHLLIFKENQLNV